MSDSDRDQHPQAGLIVGGIIVAVLFAVSLIGWGLWQSAEYERQADNQTREYSAYTNQEIRQGCLSLAGNDQAHCIAERDHEQRTYERNERDLVAQRQSALWAYIMGAAAVIGMGLSVIGVVLVWTTFREAQRTANAAFAANEIAQTSGERQLRAYVAMCNGQFESFGNRNAIVSMQIRNSGQTPAYAYRSVFDTVVCPPGERPDIPLPADLEGMPHEMLGPGTEVTEQVHFGPQLDRKKRGQIKRHELKIYTVGLVEYRDAFGDVWHYRFRMRNFPEYPPYKIESDFDGDAEVLFRPRPEAERRDAQHTANDGKRNREATHP